MDAVCRVQWDAQFYDWVAHFHPSGGQCFELFNWVLDVTEYGAPPAPVPAAEEGVLVDRIDSARLNIFYVEWADHSTVAVVELIGW